MASVWDVADVLVGQVSSALYPNGTGQPSVPGNQCIVYAGWPTESRLDDDLRAGKAHITVYPRPEERNTTRYAPKQHVMSIKPATITLASAGSKLTVGGAMPSPFTPHNVAALIDGVAFIYPAQANDTLTSIATGLATLIAAKYPGTTSAGPVITLPAGVSVTAARVGTTGTVTTEWERQEQSFQIIVWANDPTSRKAIGSAIRNALSQIHDLTMADGFGANVKYQRSVYLDSMQKEKLYRHDLFYCVEYATTVTQTVATVVAAEVIFEDMQGDVIASRTY
jgi:hypothetical protein